MPIELNPKLRSSYQAWVQIPVRFGDQDVMGHVNNAVIATYFEHARCTLLIPRILSADHPDLNIVLARIVIDYVEEINFPATLDVGLRMAKIGGKSFVVGSAIFAGDTCFAVADATIVFFDTKTRRSAEPTAAARAALESFR